MPVPVPVPVPPLCRSARRCAAVASSINNPAMEVRYVRRLHKEFDKAVKAGEQEGFTVCLVDGEILSWVVKFKGPVS